MIHFIVEFGPEISPSTTRDQDEAALSSVSLTPTKRVASKDRTNIKNWEEDNVENHNDIESEEFDDADNEELIRLAGIIAKGSCYLEK